MTGRAEPDSYLPYFFSDLFDFGYEAVGELDPTLDTFVDWQQPNRKGVIYYLRDSVVRGVMLCNLWEKVDAARELIRRAEKRPSASLRGAIR